MVNDDSRTKSLGGVDEPIEMGALWGMGRRREEFVQLLGEAACTIGVDASKKKRPTGARGVA
jgi:hypothetical protein